jgi:pyruvate formate lyase activating enzyme
MNELEIKGYLPTSLIDYPGKICSVIFLPNCNFRCPFCQNPELILKPKEMPNVEIEHIIEHLKSKHGWIDGVCITGGEPTLHAGLSRLLSEIKKLGFLIKLDTNGTNPEMLKQLIDEKLVDYIAMDIKAPLEKYEDATKVKVEKNNIKKSIDMIRKSGIDYEFRTTVVPRLIKKEDIKKIGQWLKGSKKYCIQQFRPDKTLDKSFENEKPYTPDELKQLAKEVKPYFKEVCVRGI